MATIFRKTQKGQVEIETRVNRLAQRLRAALIMVDGRRTDEQLARLIPVDPLETLHILLEAGYIEVLPGLWSTPGSGLPPVQGAAAVAPESAMPLEPLRAWAIAHLQTQLGPLAEACVRQIEQAHTWDAFQMALAVAYQQLTLSRGSAVAEEFRQRLLHGP